MSGRVTRNREAGSVVPMTIPGVLLRERTRNALSGHTAALRASSEHGAAPRIVVRGAVRSPEALRGVSDFRFFGGPFVDTLTTDPQLCRDLLA